MITLLSQVDSTSMGAAIGLLLLKALPVIILLFAWGRWSEAVDKDAEYFHLPRGVWNGVNIGTGVLAFLGLFLIPLYIIGLPVAIVLIIASVYAYISFRNGQVEPQYKWYVNAETIAGLFSSGKKKKGPELSDASLRFPKHPEQMPDAPVPETEYYVPHMALEAIIAKALERSATRIELKGNEKAFIVQVTVDSVDYKLSQIAAKDAVLMIDYLKAQASMEVKDRRRKQIGQTKIEMPEVGSHTLRVHTSGSTRGLECIIYIDPEKQVNVNFDKLGLLERQVEKLRGVFENASGVVLVAAPHGHGATTTLYALLQQQDPYTMDIQTLETLIERDLEAINQVQIEPEEIPKRLNSLLLRDPKVVMISEIGSPEVARTMAEASLQDKRLYAPVQASDTMSALVKWVKAVGDPDLALKSLSAVVAARLIRKVCNVCKQQYKPDAATLKKLNLPADKIPVLVRPTMQIMVKNQPQPCPACHGTGYDGVTGIFEVMTLDPESRKVARTGGMDQLRTQLRRQKMLWLQEAALAKAVAGLTSIKEVNRVLGSSSKASPEKKTKPAEPANA